MGLTDVPARVLQLIEAFPSNKWPSPRLVLIGGTVHQNAIDRALGFLPEADRNTLKERQVVMDEDQSEAASNRHGMHHTKENAAQARTAANDFVRQEIEAARKLEAVGARDNAMMRLGNAIHTLQDSTSPSHHDFQEWRWYYKYLPQGLVHILKENYDPGQYGTANELDRVTRTAYDYFTGAQPMPADFFANVRVAEPAPDPERFRRMRERLERRW